VAGIVTANVTQVNGSSNGVSAFAAAINAIGTGTVDSGSTTTNIVTSAISPTATVLNQFKGQVICFNKATTTTNLRGVKAVITASDSSGELQVSPALPATPASGDTFTIQ